ncbi:synaptic vesicle glycoprotein 2C-like [Photinus pyralis]|nr:synaptic vesicle glycoprotein 2C-like [Photinus pyralis]
MASCAFCFISTGLQYGLSAYAMPAAHCELNLLPSEIGFINASFLVGGTSSALLWGVIADLNGRRKVLIIALLSDVAVTICCALTQNFFGLMICRFFNGFLIGAPGSVTFTYLAEFHAPKHRTKSIYYSGVFSTIPWLILPALAWSILPLKIDVHFGEFLLYSPWRVFLIILTLPEIIGGIMLINLPESPKFLAENAPDSAMRVLQKMYNVNNRENVSECPIKHLDERNICRPKSPTKRTIRNLILKVYVQVYILFRPPLLSMTLLTTLVTFSNMFGYYGMGLWLPELLNRRNENASLTTTLNTNGAACLPEFDVKLYENTIVIGIVALFSNLLAGWLSDKFEKRIIPLVTLLVGGISTGCMYWVNSPLQYLIASCIFQSTMSISNIALGSVVVDLFPTDVNAIAICTAVMAGRVGAIFSNIVFGYLIDVNVAVAIFLVAGILIMGGLLCFFIPNSNTISLDSRRDSIEISVIKIESK